MAELPENPHLTHHQHEFLRCIEEARRHVEAFNQIVLDEIGDMSAILLATGRAEGATLANTGGFWEQGSLAVDPIRHSCTWGKRVIELTVTEMKMLTLLARYSGHVKTRDQLMDVAYVDTVFVDDRTIDSHIKRLRKKFVKVDEDFGQIETIYGVGYRWRDTEPGSGALTISTGASLVAE